MALAFLASVRQAALWQAVLLALAVLGTCVSLGALFEGRARLWWLERLRLFALLALLALWGLWLVPAQWPLALALATLPLACVLWLQRLSGRRDGDVSALLRQ